MSEHITRLAERLQQQVGESHNKPTGKQFEEMLTDALDAEHLTVEPDTDKPETETEDDVPEGFERTVKGLFGLFPTEEFNMDSADRYAEYKSLLALALKYSVHVTMHAVEKEQFDIVDASLLTAFAALEALKTVRETEIKDTL